MPAQHISKPGHADEHDGEQHVVAQGSPLQQEGVAGLVDEETTGRDACKPQAGLLSGVVMPAKTQAMVAGERDAERHEPAQHIGHERRPTRIGDQGGGDAPVHRSGGASDDHEPTHMAALSAGESGRENGAVHAAQKLNSRRRICVCVDDFGLHAGINQAVLELVVCGRVQAVSAMTGAPQWGEGARAIRQIDRRNVEVGLHLDLTEFPIDSAMRLPLGTLIQRAYLRRLDEASLRKEIGAQLDAFEAAMGEPPAYVDGHQHVHQLPQVRALLVAELIRRYPHERPWLRATRGPRGTAHEDLPTQFKRRVVESLGAHALSSLARAHGLRQNQHLLGVYGFEGNAADYLHRLQRWLNAACDGDLLMCHAGLADPERSPDAIAPARAAEFTVMAGTDFETLWGSARIVLLPMGRILEAPDSPLVVSRPWRPMP